MEQSKRVIVHVDLDAFYCQVEILRLGLDPSLPMAVLQWTGLIAVNYAARAAGITRHVRLEDALRICPEIRLVHVETLDMEGNPVKEENTASRQEAKVSLRRYRTASTGIFKLFLRIFGEKRVEKASVDEAYIDVSSMVDELLTKGATKDIALGRAVQAGPTVEGASGCVSGMEPAVLAMLSRSDTHIIGPTGMDIPQRTYQTTGLSELGQPLLSDDTSDVRISCGGVIAAYIRERVLVELGYTCSAGVAHNKMLAKLASARNKPSKQTLVPMRCVQGLMAGLPLRKIRFLGGKIGVALAAAVLSNQSSGTASTSVDATQARRDNLHGVDSGSEFDSDEERDELEGEEGQEHTAGLGFMNSLKAAGTVGYAGGKVQHSLSGNNSVFDSARPTALEDISAGAAQGLSMTQLRSTFDEKNAAWLYALVRGNDDSPIIPRVKPQQLMAAKSIEKRACRTFGDAAKWLRMLCSELADRLAADEDTWQRVSKKLTLHLTRERTFQSGNGQSDSKSKVGSMPNKPWTVDSMLSTAIALLRKVVSDELGGSASVHDDTLYPTHRLALSASGFVDFAGTAGLDSFFQSVDKRASSSTTWAANPHGGGECVPQHVHGTEPAESISSKPAGKRPALKGIDLFLKGDRSETQPRKRRRTENDDEVILVESSQESIEPDGVTGSGQVVSSSLPASGDSSVVYTCPMCTSAIIVPRQGSSGALGPKARMAAINAHIDACLKR